MFASGSARSRLVLFGIAGVLLTAAGLMALPPERQSPVHSAPAAAGEFPRGVGNGQCAIDEDCDDGIECTLDECIDEICLHSPQDELCPDDGVFCNGLEYCDEALGCRSTGNPCVEGPFTVCDEDGQACQEPTTEIVLINGPVCRGESETIEVCITLPQDATFNMVDVFVLFDDTASFEGILPAATGLFQQVVADLQTALPTVDLAFGVGRFEDYGGPGNTFDGDTNRSRPYILNQAMIQPDHPDFGTLMAAALAAVAPGLGGDGPETSAGEALYQAAMGMGFDGNGNGNTTDSGPAGAPTTQVDPGPSGDVPGFDSLVGETDGLDAGVGWRPGALRLILLATDACSVAPFDSTVGIPLMISGTGSDEPSSVFACALAEPGVARFGFVADAKAAADNTIFDAVAPLGAATIPDTVAALNAAGIRVIGLAPGGMPTTDPGPDPTPSTFLSALARLTGAVDAMGDPLVFDIAGGADPLTAAIVDSVAISSTSAIDMILTSDPALPGLTVTALPGVRPGVGPGDSVCFDVTFLGEEGFIGGELNLRFRDEASNAIVATVPVSIICDAAERPHPGWNWVNGTLKLTGNQPTYWSSFRGPPPWSILDPGTPPGRPDPDGSDDRVIRGYWVAWAVDRDGRQIRWNHLSASATVINYRTGSALAYNGYAFQALSVGHGEQVGTPGVLMLDGINYEAGSDELVLDFYAPLTTLDSGSRSALVVDTDLTLMPLAIDLRQDGEGPATTKAKFDIWNMNEFKFSGTERCVSCWDQTLLTAYDPPNHFLRANLQTDKGKARIDGMLSDRCPESVDTPLVGLAAKLLSFEPQPDTAMSAMNLVGIGVQPATILHDVRGGSPPERPASGFRGASPLAQDLVRGTTTVKGSLLVLPFIEVRWDAQGNMIQDTFVELLNDYPEEVSVHMYFVNGDRPLAGDR